MIEIKVHSPYRKWINGSAEMIEIKVHYWPETPNLRELKFYVNEKLELSVFCDYMQMVFITEKLQCITNEMLKGFPDET